MSVWVYKLDGSIQCEDRAAASPEEMREELAAIIGSDHILSMEKRNIVVPRVCGHTTGAVNAYEITQEGAYILFHGFIGSGGFERWWGDSNFNLTQLRGQSVVTTPISARELIGRPLRVYKSGEPLTEDWIPMRVNIEIDDASNIQDIWFG